MNIGVFLGQLFLTGYWHYANGMPDRILRWLGANASRWTIADNRFETLVTSCFLHGSLLHLGVNMVILWQVGPLLERAIGSARFLSLYLAAGVIASASSAIWGRFFGQTVSVGASGALCGLIAAAVVVGFRTEGRRSELAFSVGRWLVLIAFIGIARALFAKFAKDGSAPIAQIDNAAHFGGALAGALIAATWERGYNYSLRAQQAILAACIGVVLMSGLVVYVRNRTDPFLFLDIEERTYAADTALRNGNCDRARAAIRRAMQMDPGNQFVRERVEDIDRECWDPALDRRR